MSANRGVTYRNKKMADRTLGANKAVCNEVVDWSISQSRFDTKYSESESMKEHQIDQNSMLLLQTRQEERYVIWFGLLLEGNLTCGDDL